MKVAIYPGSFDPVTNGHVDIIKRAAKLFGRVIVAVIGNPGKNPQFTLLERVQMLKASLQGVKNVQVDSFDGLLVDYAKKKKAKTIVRGLRAVSDFDYEFQMALTNRKMAKDIETVFLMTDYKYSYLSSSFVKQIAGLGGDVGELVPKAVALALK
ncbi:pantetheine-phosphate adenylyltransferase [candidate division WOR-1 bacterium RIFOXYB2_FULL_42_35]|uniref:Phosphopantetheine adenylyltransferase n=1 Tax=candidate division WOR-1 bacterium RIFOXYC2_FULL_41_25 TaxID=1802586 RepID=A0A1F4TKM1_UNCSA|nr:MAG: pantetheine-phosphate adenylyltransferase [candidate division WOR-1 bacterium RIFOXYA2_FULL_41_14]OGC22496.1 MAG: pantetheine-phosphate adenylyltransferase [candidate division WOR-1 bacterium RIFOXYB2_FULL_42_35]OGC33234.1 MAG: pantetheine-phosphate adenylyltransferase [candidate division WOR-1 bacterium RIFOXYC2_FULL_41_25]OGC42768.1 MAG: pantetheine-phosphate adenylyltransferase [candidate division WOR-1 bacterium RIFOXYD2_FULL_41_8]